MSGAASISGLASGLDTATIIEQFMQLEALPQARLKNRATSEQLLVNRMQTFNTALAGLATRAADLAKPAAWTAVTATSSESAVSVTAGASAGPSSFSLRVDQTASVHRLEFTSPVARDAAGTVPTTVRLDQLDGTTVDLTTDGTLQGLADAINDPANATGLRATTVRVGADQYRLLVESTTTGADTDFTLTDAADGSTLLGGAAVRAGRDAQVTLGDSIVATSTTNTFTDLVPGVTVTLAPGATSGTTSQVALTRDPAALTSSMKSLVDAVNAALTEIDALTASSATAGARGALAGDSSLRGLRSQLLDTVFPGDGTSLAGLGIQTDRSGKVVLDELAFTAAYSADPAGTQQRLTNVETGFVAGVQRVAHQASDKVDGTVTTTITGRTESIRRLNDDIEAWDARLELRRTSLTRQFTALETALSQMSSQSSWLAGQISSLSSGSGS